MPRFGKERNEKFGGFYSSTTQQGHIAPSTSTINLHVVLGLFTSFKSYAHLRYFLTALSLKP